MRHVIAGAVFFACTAALAAGTGSTSTTTPSTTPTTTAAPMDMSKVGPATRKPTNEGQTKKEITEFIKQEDELMKKGDLDAMFARVDYPVYMVSDDTTGKSEGVMYSKDQYASMMRPMMENSTKDMKITHKPTITVMSDNMATVVDDYTMTMGKTKFSAKSTALLVKKNGSWMWKVMAEPGWAGMSPPSGVGGSSPDTKVK